MASIQSTTALVSKTLVILETSSDWNNWFKIIQAKANTLQVWQYVNSDATNIAPQEPEPISLDMAIETGTDQKVTRFTQLTGLQQSTYRFLKEEYKEDMANYRRIATGIAEIFNHIMDTISQSNFTLLMDTSPKAALITLRLHLAPSTLAQEHLVAQQYTKAKQGPGKANNIDKWMYT
ncbi:MAG: hypothetical protein M1829_002687 [Trizodia sp. TS-e1964]|nr:MAG: hypothetical protein M1829_002687 [Trizodia sp. TS-e1964]